MSQFKILLASSTAAAGGPVAVASSIIIELPSGRHPLWAS